jgi:membrane-bound ClpP family serine protease
VNRGTGTGLIGLGIVLMVVGAIMRFAVKVHTTGFNIHTAGVIILIAGGLIFVLGLGALLYAGRDRTTTVRHDVRATPMGEQRIEEREDPGPF